MSGYNRTLVRMMAKTGGIKMTRSKDGSRASDIEWCKWWSYSPGFEQERIEYLESKIVADTTLAELEEIIKYRSRSRMAKLIKIYGTSECSEDEYMEIYDFMEKESIEELMLSKLSSEELNFARDEIKRLSQISSEQLSEKVHEEQKPENYAKLSMVDSYVLHMISKVNYARSMAEINREMRARVSDNDVMGQRTFYYASNPDIKGR